MSHIAEHTLELYVLGASSVDDRREEIAAHLRTCEGCALLAREIEAIYRATAEELAAAAPAERSVEQALLRPRREMVVVDEPFPPPVAYGRGDFTGRVWTLFRHHPVASVASGVTLMGIAAALVFTVLSIVDRKDLNPSYPLLDKQRGQIELYNAENNLLWSLPSKNLLATPYDALEMYQRCIAVCDLDGDGTREFLTTIPVGAEPYENRPLSIYSADGKLVLRKEFPATVEFRGTKYPNNFAPAQLVVRPGKGTELFVQTSNNRSPNILLRLDKDLKEIGSYIHYGAFSPLETKWSDGSMKIAIAGENDLGDRDSLSSPILAILEPDSIRGNSESIATRGFGLGASGAELYYIRFPLTDMHYALKTQGIVQKFYRITVHDRPGFSVWTHGTVGDSGASYFGAPSFEFILSDALEVLEVKYDSRTVQMRQRLIEEGRVTGSIDDAYLEALKHGVRYWDGADWQPAPTRVRGASPGASPGL